MSKSNLESLMKIFSFDKRKDLERYCRDLTIRSDDFFALVLACECSGEPFIHEISHRDRVPTHLVPSDSEIEALKNTPAGTLLSGDAAKAARKMSQSFEERRYLVGHMFFVPTTLSGIFSASINVTWRARETTGRKVLTFISSTGSGRDKRQNPCGQIL
jgi:hypothetical protein